MIKNVCATLMKIMIIPGIRMNHHVIVIFVHAFAIKFKFRFKIFVPENATCDAVLPLLYAIATRSLVFFEKIAATNGKKNSQRPFQVCNSTKTLLRKEPFQRKEVDTADNASADEFFESSFAEELKDAQVCKKAAWYLLRSAPAVAKPNTQPIRQLPTKRQSQTQ